jgi:hypothetical protein
MRKRVRSEQPGDFFGKSGGRWREKPLRDAFGPIFGKAKHPGV